MYKEYTISTENKEKTVTRFQQEKKTQISSSGAKSHFRVAIFLCFLPGDAEDAVGVVAECKSILSVNFNWSMRRRADSMSLSRPSRFELRDNPKAFRVLGFLVGDWQFSSRSRAVILLRSWSFSNSMSWNFSSEDGCGSSQTAKRLSGFGHGKGSRMGILTLKTSREQFNLLIQVLIVTPGLSWLE